MQLAIVTGLFAGSNNNLAGKFTWKGFCMVLFKAGSLNHPHIHKNIRMSKNLGESVQNHHDAAARPSGELGHGISSDPEGCEGGKRGVFFSIWVCPNIGE